MINTPFNYTGSKFKLLPQLLPKLDYSKKVFVDIFAGGGSMYTNVLGKYQYFIVNDIIKDLMIIQKTLYKGNATNFINKVKSYGNHVDNKDRYNTLRQNYNDLGDPARLWALMLTCTNNMLRFNKKFKFNQTYGKRNWNKNTDKKVEAYLEHIRRYPNVISFGANHFTKITPNENCMVYLDPPYFNTEAGYNCYWSQEDEDKLYTYLKYLDKINVSFMLSGTLIHGGKISQLLVNLINYGFTKIELDMDYNKVSRKGKKNVQEIIITNY